MGRTSRWLPSNRLARGCVAPAVVFIATATNRNYLTDFWHHLARGRAMFHCGSILPYETSSFTIGGSAVRDPNWLTQLGFYGLYELGGLALVVTVNSLLLALAVGLVTWLAWRELRSSLAAAGLWLAMFFGLWQLMIVRPQTVSIVFFAALLLTLLNAERRRHWLCLPPLLCGLWVNLHGAFPIGLILVGCFTASGVWQAWRGRSGVPSVGRSMAPWLACAAACFVATLANPYGWRIYEYVLVTSGQATGRGIDEWRPAQPDQLVGLMFYASLALAGAALWLGRKRITVREAVLLVAFLPLAAQAVRMVVWWWIVLPVVASRLLAPRLPAACQDDAEDAAPTWSAAAFCCVLLIGVTLALPWCERFSPLLAQGSQRLEQDLDALLGPVKESQTPSRVFTRFEWGEFLAWALPQNGRIFMDGRMENYPPRVWEEYFAVTQAGADWQAILDRYAVDYLLLDRQFHCLLLSTVEASDTWQVRGDCGRAVLFQRSAAGSNRLAVD